MELNSWEVHGMEKKTTKWYIKIQVSGIVSHEETTWKTMKAFW